MVGIAKVELVVGEHRATAPGNAEPRESSLQKKVAEYSRIDEGD